MLRLRAYEKLQYLVFSGAVKKDGKLYTGDSEAKPREERPRRSFSGSRRQT